jgi:hypothetical protein
MNGRKIGDLFSVKPLFSRDGAVLRGGAGDVSTPARHHAERRFRQGGWRHTV